MRISIPQDKLSVLLSRCQSVVERRSTRPILENLLIEAYDHKVKLFVTDLRVSLSQEAECDILAAGSACLPARKLYEIIRELPKSNLTLESKDDSWATVTSGRSVFHLPTTVAQEYPSVPSVPSNFVKVPGAVFRRMVESTLFAASADESRIYLTGVFIKKWVRDDGTSCLRMVATDGHRLTLMDRRLAVDVPGFEQGVIVPKKGLSELKGLLEGLEGDFLLTADQGRLYALVDGTNLSVTLIDSAFPNYEQVIPTDVKAWIDVGRQDMSNALRRVAILSDEETRTVVLEAKEDAMALTSDSPRMGDAREELEVRYSGAPIRIAFNAQYFLEVIRMVEGDRVQIGVSDPLAPCLVKAVEDPDYLSVVMPMRLD